MSENQENREEVEGENEETVEGLSAEEVCGKFRSVWKEAKPYTPRQCIHVIDGEEVVLETSLRNVQLTLKYKSSCDLDMSCLAYDTKGKFHEAVYFNNTTSKDESMIHLGDASHEKIHVNLDKAKNAYSCLVFVVNIYSKAFFYDRVKDMKIRLDVLEKRSVITKFTKMKAVKFHHLPKKKYRKDVTAMVMGVLFRPNNDPLGNWTFRSVGKRIDGRSVLDQDQFKKAKKYIPLPALSEDCPFYNVVAKKEKKIPTKLRSRLVTSRTEMYLSVNGIDLPKKDVIGICDAYFEIFEKGHPSRIVAKSAIVKNEKSPVWERMDFVYNEELVEKELSIRVWDWDRATKDDYIGMAHFHLKDALDRVDGTGITLSLVNEDKGEGKAAGSVGIVCQKAEVTGVSKPVKYRKLNYYFDDDWKKKAITSLKGKK